MNSKIYELSLTLIDMLIELGQTISVSESITGGLLASSLTDVSGASNAFLFGNCTYSYEMKEKCFGLMEEIESAGTAVTQTVAKTMAQGVREFAGTDIALSTTGLAGPMDDAINPVGTVFIGISTRNGTEAQKFAFDKNLSRYEIKQEAVRKSLIMAINYLEGGFKKYEQK